MVIAAALALTLAAPEAGQTAHLTCTMAAAKKRSFRLSVGQTKVTLNGQTYNAVFSSAGVVWTQPMEGGGGYYLLKLNRTQRSLTIRPMRNARTPLGKLQLGSCKARREEAS
jgi:hypothetical protein